VRTPGANASTRLWTRIVVYLIARLTQNRLTRHLVAFIQPALDHLEATELATFAAERALVVARAHHDGADDELDEVVTQLEGQVYLHVRKDRKSALYKKLFPNGLVAITAARIPDEIAAVKILEAAVARELDGVDFATRLLPELRAAREEIERQQPLLQTAIDALSRTWAAELAARHDIRRQYRVMFAELIKLFPENIKKVNSFFRDPGTPRPPAADETEEETVAPPATPIEPGIPG